jgi:AcrR family transcriptional regulator
MAESLDRPWDRLPSGHHGLSRQVVEHQRARLLAAMGDVVAAHGYASTTVAELIVRARVSRRCFYEHFDERSDCFLQAFALTVERLTAAVQAACERETLWPESVRAGIEAVLGGLLATVSSYMLQGAAGRAPELLPDLVVFALAPVRTNSIRRGLRRGATGFQVSIELAIPSVLRPRCALDLDLGNQPFPYRCIWTTRYWD